MQKKKQKTKFGNNCIFKEEIEGYIIEMLHAGLFTC